VSEWIPIGERHPSPKPHQRIWLTVQAWNDQRFVLPVYTDDMGRYAADGKVIAWMPRDEPRPYSA
jgi:hypothetical protein